MTSSRLFWVLALATATLFACASRYSWQVSVPLPGPVEGLCLKAALDADDRVFDVVQTGPDRFAFVLMMPGEKRADLPSFSLGTTAEPGEPRSLELSTSYKKGLFSGSPNPQLERASDLAVAVTEACTGRRPTLGDPLPCGKGEMHDTCIRGHF